MDWQSNRGLAAGPRRERMSIGTIILIILVIALLGGFSGIGGGPFYGTGYYGGGGLGVGFLILLFLLLVGRIFSFPADSRVQRGVGFNCCWSHASLVVSVPATTACVFPRTPSALPWHPRSSPAARSGFPYRRCFRRMTSRRSLAWRIFRAGSPSAIC